MNEIFQLTLTKIQNNINRPITQLEYSRICLGYNSMLLRSKTINELANLLEIYLEDFSINWSKIEK